MYSKFQSHSYWQSLVMDDESLCMHRLTSDTGFSGGEVGGDIEEEGENELLTVFQFKPQLFLQLQTTARSAS